MGWSGRRRGFAFAEWVLGALAASMVGSALALGAPFTVGAGLVGMCELYTVKRGHDLERMLALYAGEAPVSASAYGASAGCCEGVSAAIALVPEGPRPSWVSEGVRWTDAEGQVWVTMDGRESTTYEWRCQSCGDPVVREAFEATDDPDAVVWVVKEAHVCPA